MFQSTVLRHPLRRLGFMPPSRIRSQTPLLPQLHDVNVCVRAAVASIAGTTFTCIASGPIGIIYMIVPMIAITLIIVVPASYLLKLIVIRLPDREFLKACFITAASYLLGTAFVGIGGCSLQVLSAGPENTNFQGYFTWSWVYGLVFMPIVTPLLFWILQPYQSHPARRPRGFDVLRTGQPASRHSKYQF